MIHYAIDSTIDSFLKLAQFFSSDLHTTLLLSGQGEKSPSYLCLFPYQSLSIQDSLINPWEQLKQHINHFNDFSIPKWVGYLSYEMSSYSDQKISKHNPLPIPLAQFTSFSVILKYQEGQLLVFIVNPENKKAQDWIKKFSSVDFLVSFLKDLPPLLKRDIKLSMLCKSDTEQSYIKKVMQAKEHILNGDIYQVNLSQSVTFNLPHCGFDLFYTLYQENPSLYSAYINTNAFQIISASPELFLKLKDNILETRPIKGTLKRSSDPSIDCENRFKLQNNIKENAELMMICDLMRNDLGQISQLGSVKCDVLKKVLELSNVFHLESTIRSTPLKKHPIDLLRSCFPPGSISGCPKLRSLEIIQKIEQRARHIYCGSIGYIASNGDFEFNVAIRTALLKNQQLQVQLGGAITVDSDPISEYEETLAKGRPFYNLCKSIQHIH